MHWHQKDTNEAIEALNSSIQGISSEEALKRLQEFGTNELKEKKKKTPLMMFLDQFRDFMILVLIAAAVISGIIGEPSDTIAIAVIVILNAIIGFVQEYRAEKAMAALKKMSAPVATVIRDGGHAAIPAAEIVPGDIVLLDAGSFIPADVRLLETAQLRIEEAALTGESVPADKHTTALHDEAIPLGDRRNMAYKGTIVAYGRGSGIVTATGMDTELGRIAKMLQEEEEVKTPLQKRLAVFGRRIAFAVLAICAVVFSIGVLRGEQPIVMFLTAISLAVAAIPEALPAVVTISLAIGARKMVKQNALIRKLPAVETLGSVTYICSDKTGTLTQNRMSVEEMYVDGRVISSQQSAISGKKNNLISDLPIHPFTDSPIHLLFTALALSNDAKADRDGNVIGDPTEVALFSAARENGFDKPSREELFPRVEEIPFDSERKCMTTFHKIPTHPPIPPLSRGGEGGVNRFVSFTKGAIEVLLEKSDGILKAGGTVKIDREEIYRVNERMAADGLRVLGIAMRGWDELPSDMSHANVERGLIIIGLVGIMDPPREEAKEAVSICKKAGIIPVMITGDHPITAWAIARRIGIIEEDDVHFNTITGRELEKLSLKEFEERVEDIQVYARVAPEQKLKIVKALQDKGEFVAMTGDGVNDAPALKRADIGIAMGITGADAAKEASHMILLDDNFATIVKAVKEGRKIYDNIRKFVKYLLSTNSGEIWTLFLAPLISLPIPLLPIHILWINLMTDGLPALALSVEPAETDVMKRPPRSPKESIFAGGLGFFAIWVGLLMAALTLSVQAWSIKTGNSHWQTMVFTVLCLSQLGNALAIRSEKESLCKIGFFSNKAMLGAVSLSFALQMAAIYVPFLNPIFKTEPLSFNELMITIALSSVVFFAVELEKFFRRKQWFKY
ncbi:MAG: ATPase [Nitrospirae bacterium CG_4_10_14_3_um_filter_44_29]|nr:cation-translocating P-type ATPase [Nitrospirota bacterium]PIP69341.1 MAG: ATPase [Nitrospirae bacterium CG22_combo_CG10-13_8_21_14_all_44_11]PIV43868.1 MAG: ATPase [Nitrospirae bacterium CG02_land_8_20_14_3_00_44_33]PIV65952.1 MAG: ATPase [Nitrospirae bacterium CG01_land_8_20_14_3_00_44_22]PIX88391.1 MAG: ATPase [Nitrospirae bacterium CG_4_10_14_3_um_filter_44_29]PJA81719.1 MAG: ATPase [Nitrospirae bacterium CG_4_9_14_3_um_filter_44_28]